jgi:hypothetical protein
MFPISRRIDDTRVELKWSLIRFGGGRGESEDGVTRSYTEFQISSLGASSTTFSRGNNRCDVANVNEVLFHPASNTSLYLGGTKEGNVVDGFLN